MDANIRSQLTRSPTAERCRQRYLIEVKILFALFNDHSIQKRSI